MKYIALMLTLSATVAHAEFFTGNEIFDKLSSRDIPTRNAALGYIAGVADSTARIYHCIPPSATLRQASDIVMIALEASPTDRHYSADVLVTRALKFAWPCPKKEKGTSL